MFTIEITLKEQVGSNPPSYQWRCPLCKAKFPMGEERTNDTRRIDVDARVHLMTSHNVAYAMMVTKDHKPAADCSEAVGKFANDLMARMSNSQLISSLVLTEVENQLKEYL